MREAATALITLLATGASADAGDLLSSPATLASAYSEYKFGSGRGLALRTAREDWDGARRTMRDDPAVQRWTETRIARVRDWMARGIDRSGWNAGWGHDLVDPRTGNPIKWSVGMAEPPLNVAGGKLHGAWVYYQRTQNIAMTLEAARLSRLTDDTALRSWATDQLTFYAANYLRWPAHPGQGRTRMMWQSLDEAKNGIILAEAARLLKPSVTDEVWEEWRTGLFSPLLANLETSNSGCNNISVWQASAAGTIALLLDDDGAWDRAIYGQHGIEAMLRKGVLADYLWFEPSSAYGIYTINALANLYLAASLAGKADALARDMLLTQNMLIAYAAMRFTDGKMPSYGDSPAETPALNDYILQLTQRTMPIRVPKLALDWGSLLDPGLPQGILPAETQSRYWAYSQLAMMRDGPWELFTSWGQQSRSHAQQDALSYTLRYGGAEISSPAGMRLYGSPLFLGYLRKSAAHNMPLIDGAGQIALEPGALLASSDSSLATAQDGFANGARAERTFTLTASAATITTVVEVPDGTRHRLGSAFNTGCAVFLDEEANAAPVPQGDGLYAWHNVRVTSEGRAWRTRLECAGRVFTLGIKADAQGRLFLADAPDATGNYGRTAIYFESPSASRLTVLQSIEPNP